MKPLRATLKKNEAKTKFLNARHYGGQYDNEMFLLSKVGSEPVRLKASPLSQKKRVYRRKCSEKFYVEVICLQEVVVGVITLLDV